VVSLSTAKDFGKLANFPEADFGTTSRLAGRKPPVSQVNPLSTFE
jgi:hypothetical protein